MNVRKLVLKKPRAPGRTCMKLLKIKWFLRCCRALSWFLPSQLATGCLWLWAVDPEDVTATGAGVTEPGGQAGVWTASGWCTQVLQGRQYRLDRRWEFFWPLLPGKSKPVQGACTRPSVYGVLYIMIQLSGPLQSSFAASSLSSNCNVPEITVRHTPWKTFWVTECIVQPPLWDFW